MRLLFPLLLLANTEAFSPPAALTARGSSQSSLTTHGATPPRSSSQLFNMGRGYLDSINEEEERRNFRNDRASNGQGNNSGYFNYGKQVGPAGGGAGTAVRPPPGGSAMGQGQGKGYGMGGWGGNNAGTPQIVSIKQPQDLLDFVIEDERLSVVKVYASWCKTCQVFDIRYRKLASQIGDTSNSKGLVRFSEMQFDDPNNEEMCRLLNATKLPYILLYKGSRGKIMDFQCGPSNFQQLIDAVNEHSDTAIPGNVAQVEVGEVEEEMEWSVQQQQQQAQKNDGVVKQKDQEITRLYKELSNLRKQYDEKIRVLKEEHQYETGEMRKEMERQTKQYEEERRQLDAQIKQLTQDMIEREKAYRTGNDSTSEQLRRDLKDKEKQYENTLNSYTYKIADLEELLFKTKNELKYSTETSEQEKEELTTTIALLEEEQNNLISKNKELEKQLTEDKRLVAETTEEANKVLKQLEEMKINKEEEGARLNARIRELEQEIANIYADNNGGYDMSAEMERLKNEYQQERELMAARIVELESNQGEWQQGGSMELEQERERVLELEETISTIKRELEQRDRLLRTSNKATDILLDQMEAQKRDYEKELARTAELTNELESAIDKREIELRELKAQFSSLERIAEGLKAKDMRRISDGVGGGQGDVGNEDLRLERDMRMAAEEEVNRLRTMMNQRQQGADRDQSWREPSPEDKPKKSFFDQMFGERPSSPAGSWGNEFGDGFGFGRSQESMREVPKNQQAKDEYALLNDVLAPDEVSPRDSRDGVQGWAGYENADNSQMDSSYYTPTPSAVNEEPVRVPTPQQEFERRLAENPIVPAGAFGGSRPTATFFRPSSPQNGQYEMPSDSSESNPPTLPPAASFMPRPASPAPRVQARKGISDNIYAGAGSAGGASNMPSPSVPSPSAYEVPAQVPTPQMEFERRIAENPIVPSGAFGGSKPTADFFRKSTAAPPQTTQYDGGDQDEQAKWQSLDETERKQIAAKAYETFEKQLADRRGQDQRPRQGMGGLGGMVSQNMNSARSTLQDDDRGRGSTMGRGPPAENPARSTIQKEDQLQAERKKHQEMVQQAARDKQQPKGSAASSPPNINTTNSGGQSLQRNTENRSLGDKVRSQTKQSTQEMTRSATEASSKRAKKAQDASMELKRQNQMKADAIRREQNERRAKEETASRQRQGNEKREAEAQAARIKAEKEAIEKEKLSNELKNRKMSEAKAKAEEQKLRMEQQKRRQAAEEKERQRRAEVEQEDRARVEKQSQQAMKEQLEAEARARAVEEKIQLEERKAAKAKTPDSQKQKTAAGVQKPAEERVVTRQQPAGNSLRDLADSGKKGRSPGDPNKRMRDVVDSAAKEAKYKVVVLKEGNKSELEGPLKDLLGKPKEAAVRKSDNY